MKLKRKERVKNVASIFFFFLSFDQSVSDNNCCSTIQFKHLSYDYKLRVSYDSFFFYFIFGTKSLLKFSMMINIISVNI